MKGRGADGLQGEIGEGSERHQIKRKRVKKKLVLWVQRGTDTSGGEMARGSKRHQVKRKRAKKENASRVYGGIDSSQGKMIPPLRRENNEEEIFQDIEDIVRLGSAKDALEFYEKRHQGAEFEVVEVLHFECDCLCNPVAGGEERFQVWAHVSFTAKPKNADCSGVSPKHFFAEALQVKGKEKVAYCSTFEPSDDPGFNHGCVFCTPGEKFHPVDGYRVGRPPFYKIVL